VEEGGEKLAKNWGRPRGGDMRTKQALVQKHPRVSVAGSCVVNLVGLKAFVAFCVLLEAAEMRGVRCYPVKPSV
jgi:hypothetical protein